MVRFIHFILVCIEISVCAQTQTHVKVKDASGNESFNVTCTNTLDSNGCLPLHVEYPVLKETTGYQVSQETYNPATAFNQGTALNANYDDVFAKKLDLPFKFCFYNQYYESLVVGSNGMITFDLSQLGQINYPNVQGQNPNVNLPKNAVFGVYHDMVFSASDPSEIYYSITGTAPYRKFIISFYEGRIAGCTDRSSSQIVLNETTNVIDVFVDNKPLPCPTRKFENALIGIINSSGTEGISPASRNTGNWQASQEAWRFTPTGNVIQPQVTWTNAAGQTVATGIQTTVCPSQNEIYTANVVFNSCGNGTLTLTDDFPVTFDATYPAAKNFTQNICGNTPVNVSLNSFQQNLTSQNPANFNFSFYTTLQNAQTGQNSLANNYTVSSNTVLYVRIQNPAVPGCFRTAVLTLNFLTRNLLKNTVEICDTNNDGTETGYDLSSIAGELFPPGTSGYSYHLSQSDAQNNSNAVTAAIITANTNLWVRLQDGSCTYILGPVHFQFRPGANINTPITYPYTTCDINADNKEPFDFAVNIGPLISSQQGVTFSAYETYAAAIAGSAPALGSIKEGQYPVFIRVQTPNGCFAIAQVNMNVTFTKIEANEKNEYICFNGTDDISVNLNTLSAGMLISPATVPVTEFYAGYNEAMAGTTPVSPNQTITTNGNFVTQTYYVRFEISDQCFTVRPININLVHPVAVQSSFTVCDINNNNSENIQLNQFSAAIIGTQNASAVFYLTQGNAQNGTNPVNAITLNGTQQVFVKVTSYNCSQVYPITVGLVSTPAVNSPVTVTLSNICDNNNDGTEVYNLTLAQPQIYSGSNVTFTYYTSYNPSTQTFSGEITNPSQFPVQGNATVYVKVKFNNNECFSAAQLNIQMTFLPPVVLNNAVLSICDANFDLNETFQLNTATTQLFIASQNTQPVSNMTITYYNTAADANAGSASAQIGSSVTTNVSTVTVWARFQSKTTGCYSVASIQLNTYFPPKAINSTITVCDENLDGSYEVNLLNYTSQMVDLPNATNTFAFYLTQQDAQNNTNPIANPQNFSAQPFPAQVWVKVQNLPGCSDIASVSFVFGNKVVLQNAGPFQLNNVCDAGNDGIENVNLKQFESQMYTGSNATFTYYASLADLNAGTNVIANPDAYPFNQNTGPNTIYIKVSVPGLCPEKALINLSLKPTPVFDIPDQYICPDGSLTYTVNVENYVIIGYTWTNPSGQVVSTTNTLSGVNAAGTYTVTVTASNGCSHTDTFALKYYDVPVIEKLVADGNAFTVFAIGSQPILYSIDGLTWQTGNVFYNLPTGITTFYVKYVEGKCIIKQDGVILDIKNAITPNGDGKNDQWVVKNLHVFGSKMTNVKVFDRYQALIFEQNTNTQIVWDGTIQGRAIPTSSYWYVITLPDGRTFTGWILVKNNN